MCTYKKFSFQWFPSHKRIYIHNVQCPKEHKLKVPPQEGYVMNNATLNIQTSGGQRLCRHMHVGMRERESWRY